MEFNPIKSYFMCFGHNILDNNIQMNGVKIPFKKESLYLGFPIGEKKFIQEFFENKFKKVEKSFYSLYTLGCRPYGLNPKTIAFIYKQYCQSIFKYGLEFGHLTKKALEDFNIRQNILIKRSIGLNKYSRTTPLFKCLKIESIQQLYEKHKIFMFEQVKSNMVTNEVFKKLKCLCASGVLTLKEESIIGQLDEISKQIGYECTTNVNMSIKSIENIKECLNLGLLDSINFILDNFQKNYFLTESIKLLTALLNIRHN